MRRVTLACTLLLPLLAAGCGDDNDTPTTPTTPVVEVTDTFAGTLSRNGGTSHPFSVVATIGGSVTASVKTIAPDGGAVVGFSLGTWNGTACQAILSNDRAIVGSALIGQATAPSMLCVRIYDVGALTDAQDYELQVVHP